MKLHEAMLKGAKMKPQCFGAAFRNGGSCAVGAAFDGIASSSHFFGDLIERFPYIVTIQSSSCPTCKLTEEERKNDKSLHPGLIPHLNDNHKWSRECIALWIRDNFEKETQINKTEIKEKQSCLSV